MTKEQRREKMRTLLQDLYWKGNENGFNGNVVSSERSIDEALTALEALMPKEDRFQGWERKDGIGVEGLKLIASLLEERDELRGELEHSESVTFAATDEIKKLKATLARIDEAMSEGLLFDVVDGKTDCEDWNVSEAIHKHYLKSREGK